MYSNPEVKLDQKLSKTFNCYKTTTSKTTKNIFTLWKGFPKKKKKKAYIVNFAPQLLENKSICVASGRIEWWN